MRHLIGLVLCSYGLWLLYGALRHRRTHALAPASGQLAILADIMPPLVIMGIGVAALEVVLAYAVVGQSRHFSLFDLIGVLFVLASYGAWILVKTRYRGSPDAGPG
ncbi:MAG: hypothetical protein K2Y51_20600 [Gammaproteobacteria bacterium]|jgi:uncharacterized membrane protein|nr:hypothetical protein [Gammaproteobacteria bacterium]